MSLQAKPAPHCRHCKDKHVIHCMDVDKQLDTQGKRFSVKQWVVDPCPHCVDDPREKQ